MTTLFTQTNGHGQDLVLLHGWGTHSAVWQFLVAVLQNHFRVTTVDLPGFGKSQVNAHSLTAIIELLKDVVPKSAIWLGWSLGGLLATQLALSYPDKVSKLICVASSPRFIQDDFWPGVPYELLTNFSAQLQNDYKATLKRFLLLQFYGISFNKDHFHWLDTILNHDHPPTMAALLTGLNLLNGLDLRQQLKQLQCASLYLLGKCDRLVPVKIATLLSHYNSNIQTVVFPKASHAPFLSHQDEFLKALQKFIYD